MNFKRIKIATTILISLLTIIFFSKTFLDFQGQAQDFIFSIHPVKIIASLLLFLGHLYLRALSWRFLIYSLGESVSKTQSLKIWFLSEATRYIPVGKIWSFASRAYLAQENKVSPKISYSVLPLEIMIVSATVGILSFYAIIKTLKTLPLNLTFYAIFLISLITILVLVLLHKKINKILRGLIFQNFVPEMLLKALIIQILSWFLYSAGYIVLLDNISRVQDIPLLFSTTLLAWLIGYLSIVSPMGLGIREGIFVLLAGSQIGTTQASIIAILSRIILIIAELLNLIFWVGKKTNKSRKGN